LRQKVLVIDVDLERALALNRTLQARGALVDVAQTPEVAMRLYVRFSHKIVLCDAQLVLRDTRLLRTIKSSRTPVLLAAVTSDPEQARKLLALGADACISSACDPAVIAEHCFRSYDRIAATLRDNAEPPSKAEAGASEPAGGGEEDLERVAFVAMLAHDIRNALSVIPSFVEMLRESGLDHEQRHLLERIEANVATVTSLSIDYLSVAAAESGQVCKAFRPLRLNDVLRGLAEQYAPLAAKGGVTITTALCDDDSSVVGDAIALERAFGNLIHNAVKFTPPGGSVRLESDTNGREVVGRVCDDGPGLPQARPLFGCFERRAQAGRNEGNGLGLYAARRLIQAHRGRIDVESGPARGTTFSVALPTAQSPPQDVSETVSPPAHHEVQI